MVSVVIVDDNKPIADRIANTIPWKSMDCEVVAVEYDGLQGKRAISKYLPQLIIIDVRMPNLSGLETIELTRSLIPDSKVIFISAYDEFKYAYRAIKLKAYDYLIKPFSQADLLRVIQKAMTELDQSRSEAAVVPPVESKSIVQKAIEYYCCHMSEIVTMDELAKLFGVSSAHFGRLVQQETGKRFMELATQMRMDKAKTLLQNGEYRVNEIGTMVGYQTYLTFYKVFSKAVGVSPTEYAKKVQEETRNQGERT